MSLLGPHDIEVYVASYIRNNRPSIAGKICIDAPAGQGVASRIFHEVGGIVHAYDLFPEFFKPDNIQCSKADLQENLPEPDGSADYILCQEGLEHIADKVSVLREFSRVLKKGGTLLVTTPNYSNIKSRLSYLYFETEYYNKQMPPNEFDSIWYSKGEGNKIYFGHIFLTGIQQLRCIARLNGFAIKNVYRTRINKTSLLYFPFLYPLIFLVSLRTYMSARKKQKDKGASEAYREMFRLNVSPRVLLSKNLFIEFVKESGLEETSRNLMKDKGTSPWESLSAGQKERY